MASQKVPRQAPACGEAPALIRIHTTLSRQSSHARGVEAIPHRTGDWNTRARRRENQSRSRRAGSARERLPWRETDGRRLGVACTGNKRERSAGREICSARYRNRCAIRVVGGELERPRCQHEVDLRRARERRRIYRGGEHPMTQHAGRRSPAVAERAGLLHLWCKRRIRQAPASGRT